MNARMAECLFRIFRRFNIQRESDRIVIARKFVAKKKAKYISDVQTFIKDKNVLHIKEKYNNEASNN